mgnify:CR=1 FL=1
MRLKCPILCRNTFDSIKMFLVVGNNYHASFASGNTYHQIKILNHLSNTLQAKFLATEGIGNLINADNGIIIYQHSGLCCLLFAVTFRSTVCSIKQLDSRNCRNTTILVFLYAMLSDYPVAAKQLNTGRCFQKILEGSHEL